MKHLSRFSEFYRDPEIVDICNNYLTSLKDKNYNIEVISKNIYIDNGSSEIYYNDIKIDLIQLIEYLNLKYDIVVKFNLIYKPRLMNFYRSKNYSKNVNINKLINDELELKDKLIGISIYFKQKMPDDIKKFIDNFLKKY